MSIQENLRIAVYSIKTNLMRSLLTMLGIIIGVASVISIVTLGEGGRDYVVGMIEDMGANCVQVLVDTSKATTSEYISEKDIAAMRTLEGVQYISPMTYNLGTITSSTTSGMGVLVGCYTEMGEIFGMTPMHGRYPTVEEVSAGKHVAVIDNMSALAIYNRFDVVGESITYNVSGQSLTFQIVGVADTSKMMGSSSSSDLSKMMENSPMMGSGMAGGMLLVPANIVSQLNGKAGGYEMLYVGALDDNALESVGESIVKLLKIRHNNAERELYSYVNMATFIDLLNTVISVFTTFIAAVSAISLIVGGVGVMNIMLVSVTERTREIGIRKALGAKTKTIMLQFLTESVILCLIGGIIGLIIGGGGALAVAWYMKIPIGLKLSTVLIAVGFSSAIGIFFGIYPARRAARMLPIEALRRE